MDNTLSKPVVNNIRCEYLTNPLAIEAERPRLSWQIVSNERNIKQTAYQILVASTAEILSQDKGDLWDSGKVDSDCSAHVEFAGPDLSSRELCHWKVCIWDTQNNQSDFSEAGLWQMGLLEQADFSAKWITPSPEQIKPDEQDPIVIASPMLRKSFNFSENPGRAIVYVTAKGLYQLHLNGKRVGDDHLTPGWTDFYKRIYYQAYDVTEMLTEGQNVITATLGTGWYCGWVAWFKKIYGDQPELLCQLEIQTTDGQTQTVISDETWKTTTGPILGSDMIHGETYDSRLEIDGWQKSDFNDESWQNVQATQIDPDGALLQSSPAPMIRKITEITPTKVTSPADGVYIYDLAQNMVGHVRIKLKGDAGQTVTLRHAEVLNDDGTMYTENLRTAKATDRYICNGNPDGETFEPSLTIHGFRFLEVTGLDYQPELTDITGIVIHSQMTKTGDFNCSNPLINQLQHNIEWGQRGNYVEVPTDCPQRNERLGWTGDAQVFAATGCFNFNVAPFFTKWTTDLTDAQFDGGAFTNFAPIPSPERMNYQGNMLSSPGSAAWAEACIIVPWTVYQSYGDKKILQDNYDAMSRYIDHIENTFQNYIGPDEGFGDWLNDFAFTPLDLISTAYGAYAAQLMNKIASVLDKQTDAKRFAKLFENIKAAFNENFVSPNGRIVGDTQCAYVMALKFDLLDEDLKRTALERLVYDIHQGRSAKWPYEKRNDHISCGFVGVNLINQMLSDNGQLDLAYKLLQNEDYPSWLFQVKNGATTIWERWDGYHPEHGFQDPNMNSFNHYAYGAIGQWLYETVAGIRPAMPGYKEITIIPHPGGGLTQACGKYDSIYGTIESQWKIEDGKFSLNVTIPANTTAAVHIPAESIDGITESGNAVEKCSDVTFIECENGRAVLEVGSGSYCFSCRG